MEWVVLSLLAPALYAANGFIDKYIVDHRLKASPGIPGYTAIAAFIVGTSIWAVHGGTAIGMHNALLILLAGFMLMPGYLLYYYAIAKHQASYVIVLMQLTPLFTLGLSVLILGDKLSALQLAGFSFILLSVTGFAFEKGDGRFQLDKSFWAMVLADFCYAVSAIILKFTVGPSGFAAVFVYECWGVALAGVVLLASYKRGREEFIKTVKVLTVGTIAWATLSELVFIAAEAITLLAISLGPVALVNVLGGTQVLYGILFGLALTALYPRLFHETSSKHRLAIKAALVALLLLGVGFISSTATH